MKFNDVRMSEDIISLTLSENILFSKGFYKYKKVKKGEISSKIMKRIITSNDIWWKSVNKVRSKIT